MVDAVGRRGMVFAAQDKHVERRVHKEVRIRGNRRPVKGIPYAYPCLDMEQVFSGNAKEGPVDGFLGGLFDDPVVGFEAGALGSTEEADSRRPIAQLLVGLPVQGRFRAGRVVGVSHHVVVGLGLGMVGDRSRPWNRLPLFVIGLSYSLVRTADAHALDCSPVGLSTNGFNLIAIPHPTTYPPVRNLTRFTA